MKKWLFIGLFITIQCIQAQTELDALMMPKNFVCAGVVYEHSSWKNYWEGTFKRENLNLGTVSTQKLGMNMNYGITDNLNIILSLPYVKTKASAGTLLGQEGWQDFSTFLKYRPLVVKNSEKEFSVFAIAGCSIPTTNYVADYLPLAIGTKSKTISLRLMADYKVNSFAATISSAFTKRYNIEIDRNTYYSDRMHYTNIVDLPNTLDLQARMGYRTKKIIAEAVFTTWETLGKTFDISKNNMPFPSNTMQITSLGINGKYTFVKIMPSLSIVFGATHVTSGRNVGQNTSFYGGIFYAINFKKKK
jgi:hypothetical protein